MSSGSRKSWATAVPPPLRRSDPVDGRTATLRRRAARYLTAMPGIRATSAETMLLTATRVTREDLASEKRPAQNSRSWRRRISILSFCHRCWRIQHPRSRPWALFRHPVVLPARIGAPHVAGAWNAAHKAIASDNTMMTVGPSARLIHAAMRSTPARAPHHCPNPPSTLFLDLPLGIVRILLYLPDAGEGGSPGARMCGRWCETVMSRHPQPRR